MYFVFNQKHFDNDFKTTTYIQYFPQIACKVVFCFFSSIITRHCGGAKLYPLLSSEPAHSLMYLPRLRAIKQADKTEK